jgi:hypothetical protein
MEKAHIKDVVADYISHKKVFTPAKILRTLQKKRQAGKQGDSYLVNVWLQENRKHDRIFIGYKFKNVALDLEQRETFYFPEKVDLDAYVKDEFTKDREVLVVDETVILPKVFEESIEDLNVEGDLLAKEDFLEEPVKSTFRKEEPPMEIVPKKVKPKKSSAVKKVRH